MVKRLNKWNLLQFIGKDYFIKISFFNTQIICNNLILEGLSN